MREFGDKDDSLVHSVTASLTKINDFSSYGNCVVQKYKAFEVYQDMQRQELTKSQDINYVLDELKIFGKDFKLDNMKRNELDDIRKIFEEFNEEFSSHLRKFQNSPNEKIILDLKDLIIEQAAQLKKDVYFAKKPTTGQKHIFLARILAIYAILKTQENSSAEKKGKAVKITFRPHEIQVVALLLLLGIVRDKKELLANRMAEVGTGEGKSVVLATLCTYLALVGFNVRCACYSQYLSERDEATFKRLFEYLDIATKIKYGTFNAICEEILNSSGRDFKAEVKNMISKK